MDDWLIKGAYLALVLIAYFIGSYISRRDWMTEYKRGLQDGGKLSEKQLEAEFVLGRETERAGCANPIHKLP